MTSQPGQIDREAFDREAQEQSTAAARLGQEPEVRTAIMEAWSLLVRGEHGAALAKFESVLATVPQSLEAKYGLAATLKAMGRGAEAIQAYQRTLEAMARMANDADRVRAAMIKHLAESALEDLQAGGGRPAAYTPPR